MSPSRPSSNVKVQVPRHSTQRIGPALTAQVESLARSQGIKIDIRQPTNEPSSAIAQAIESASDWNSMLLTARAQRGPQWDIGTQQFQVEEGSDLYYDPTPLLGYLKEGESDEGPSDPMHGVIPGTPLNRAQHGNMGGQFSMNGMTGSPAVASPRHAMGGPYPGGGPPFNSIPPTQFYGGGDRGSPMVGRGGMGMDGMAMSPEIRRRM